MATDAESLGWALQGLGASKHLEREKALRQVTKTLSSHQSDGFVSAQRVVQQVWDAASSLTGQHAWEARLGGLQALKVLASLHCPMPPGSTSVMLERCTALLEDPEPRVRTAVGELLGAIAATDCCTVWKAMQHPILHSIESNWDRDALARKEQAAASAPEDATKGSLLGSLLSDTYKPLVCGQGDMRHGTEGWQALESSLKALLAVVQGGGQRFAQHMTHDILQLTARCMHHPNRFIRETSHLLVGAISTSLGEQQQAVQPSVGSPDSSNSPEASESHAPVPVDTHHVTASPPKQSSPECCTATSTAAAPCTAAQTGDDQQQQVPVCHSAAEGVPAGVVVPVEMSAQRGAAGAQGGGVTLSDVGTLTAPLLADGLTDSWSQVRYAACLGARALLLCADEGLRSQLLPHLLPALCLNRYYVADGVRSAAQETWRMVMQDTGRQAVAQHMDQVVVYYIAQSKAMHHGVREAAAACIAELAEKIDSQVVIPHIPHLLQALLLSCKDMAWPVRDAACVAAGRCCRALPAACAQFLPQLMQLWVAHLWDNVHSVRANSAAALADVLIAYPDQPIVLQTVKEAIEDLLPKVAEQPRDSPRGRSRSRQSPGDTSRQSPGDTSRQSPGDTRAGSHGSNTHPTPSGAPIGTQAVVTQPGGDSTLQHSSQQLDGFSDQNGSGHPGSDRSPSSHVVVRTGNRSPARPGGRLGRSRSPTPSKGRMLSPARLLEQQVKEALAANPDMFGSFEDIALFSEAAVSRFTSSAYLKGDGCMDFGFSRDQEPWEATDGAVLLITELAAVRPDVAVGYLERLADVMGRSACDFEAAPRLRETVWRCLPRIATRIGKQQLKRHLEPFLQPLFDDLMCGTQLTETAAGKAVAALRDFLGPNILAARLTEAQAHALRTSHVIPARA